MRPVGGAAEANGGKQERPRRRGREREPCMQPRQRDGDYEHEHAGGIDGIHGAASRLISPVASNSPCRSAIGLGGDPGT